MATRLRCCASRQQLGPGDIRHFDDCRMCSILGCSKCLLLRYAQAQRRRIVSRDRWDVRKPVRAVCAHLLNRGGSKGPEVNRLGYAQTCSSTERALLSFQARLKRSDVKRGRAGNLMRRGTLPGFLAASLVRCRVSWNDTGSPGRDMRVSGEVVDTWVIRVARDGMATAIDDVCRTRGAYRCRRTADQVASPRC